MVLVVLTLQKGLAVDKDACQLKGGQCLRKHSSGIVFCRKIEGEDSLAMGLAIRSFLCFCSSVQLQAFSMHTNCVEGLLMVAIPET